MSIRFVLGSLLLMVFSFWGCNKFLEAKSDMSLAIPNTVKDLQAIMDFELYNIRGYPVSGDIASDYYYMTDVNVNAVNTTFQDIYLLKGNETVAADWTETYKKVMYANVVLDLIDDAKLDGLTERDRDRVKGSALFQRGWNFYWLATLFSPAYVEGAADQLVGIPLRTSPDINISYARSTLKETFEQIVSDLTASSILLPNVPINSTRPSKPAAFAALARTYLYMGDVESAFLYADSCLNIKSDLMDYGEMDEDSSLPFTSMNEEVILHNTQANSGGIFNGSRALLDTVLLESYQDGDYRKDMLFQKNEAAGGYNFKGNYSGPINIYPYCGLATDEIFLIKAECAARLNDLEEAKASLQELLENRYESGSLPNMELDQLGLVALVLEERKKELAFRFGTRWADIKRLNSHYDDNIQIQRIYENRSLQLPPHDNRFSFLIPWEVISEGDLVQNER